MAAVRAAKVFKRFIVILLHPQRDTAGGALYEYFHALD
jgi:hypothetical protein